MIRNIVLATTAIIGLTGGVMAADLPMRSAPPVYVPPTVPVFTWTGLYVGGNVGYGGDKFNYPFAIGPVAGGASLTSSGVIGGGQVGFNYAFGTGVQGFGSAFVIGAEADFDGASISGRVSLNAGALTASAGSKVDYLGTARGRVGLAFDRLLVYATGGYAYARVNSTINAALGGVGALNAGVATNQDGYAVGGGFEYAITPNFTLKTEYIRAELGTKPLITTAILGVPARLSERTSLNIVRAGFNYKFDLFAAPAPVVARY